MYLYHNTCLDDLVTRLDNSIILDFHCRASERLWRRSSPTRFKLQSKKRLLGSSKSEWNGSCIKRIVPQFQGSSKSPRTVNQQTWSSPCSCKSFELPHGCLSVAIRSRQLDLASHLAMRKSCKESCEDYKNNVPQSHQPPIPENYITPLER